MSGPNVTRPPAYPHGALPVGTRLGEFEVRGVLGVGGFGIVYLAFDHLLEREVALKEYMPSALVERAETMHVSLISQEHADTFALGLRSFVNEARLLARFDHPSLVKVHRFWEANGTAYMAMALYKGRNVREVRLGMAQPPDEAWVRRVLEPLLGAIERLHSEDVFHRDIAPDNILIEGDGRPVLLDFGAARRVISDRSQALTAILKPSYAPIEQYADVGGMKQGAWTDVYALGATVHFLLLGRPPPPAPGRSIQDTMKSLASQALPGCTPAFLELVDWMLAPMPGDRPQSLAVVRDALAGRVKRPPPPDPFERTSPVRPGADEDATVVVTRPNTLMPQGPAGNDDATIIAPRQAPTRQHVPDEDATVVRPMPTMARTQQAPLGAQPPSVPMPPMETIAPPRQAPQAPPPPPPAPPAGRRAAAPAPAPLPVGRTDSGSGWIVPVLSGVVVAAVVGGGLWWFLTRPATAPAPAPVPPASAAAPSPAPVATPITAPAPAASVAEPAPAPAPTPAPVTTPAPAAVTSPAPSVVPPAAPVPKPVSPEPRPRPQAEPPRKTPEPTNRPTPAPTPQVQVQPSPAPSPAPSPVAPVPSSPRVQPSQAPAPAPVEPAKPADDGRPKSPSERCAKELPLVRLICIDLACNRSEFRGHPECVKLRADQEERRNRNYN